MAHQFCLTNLFGRRDKGPPAQRALSIRPPFGDVVTYRDSGDADRPAGPGRWAASSAADGSRPRLRVNPCRRRRQTSQSGPPRDRRSETAAAGAVSPPPPRRCAEDRLFINGMIAPAGQTLFQYPQIQRGNIADVGGRPAVIPLADHGHDPFFCRLRDVIGQ